MGIFDNFNFNRLKDGLQKTRNKLVTSLNETISGRAEVDEKTLDEIEEILVTSDLGYDISFKIIERARYFYREVKNRDELSITDMVKKELMQVLEAGQSKIDKQNTIGNYKPYVILIVGVNGVGKTTTVGKLANNFKKAGLKVLVGAADTFRAAANEQLDVWAERAGVEVIQRPKGSDPSSVAFDAVKNAKEKGYDVVIIDTAGRLHNKENLMNELNKIKRATSKVVPHAPNETLLVLDATTGQNALMQAEEFSKVTDLNGLILTKLDGTAKGGVVFQIIAKQKVPVKYIGVGEKIDDLQTFDPEMFVKAIFE